VFIYVYLAFVVVYKGDDGNIFGCFGEVEVCDPQMSAECGGVCGFDSTLFKKLWKVFFSISKLYRST